MEFNTNLRRLDTLKGHLQPSKDYHREKATATFDVNKAREAVWKGLPSVFFSTYEAISKFKDYPAKLHGVKPLGLSDQRREGNEYWVNTLNNLYEIGAITPEKLIDNIDECLMGFTSLSSFDGAALVKNSKSTRINTYSGPLWAVSQDN